MKFLEQKRPQQRGHLVPRWAGIAIVQLKFHIRQRKVTDEAVDRLMGLVVEPLRRGNSYVLFETPERNPVIERC